MEDQVEIFRKALEAALTKEADPVGAMDRVVADLMEGEVEVNESGLSTTEPWIFTFRLTDQSPIRELIYRAMCERPLKETSVDELVRLLLWQRHNLFGGPAYE